jgi:hypothetical protein
MEPKPKKKIVRTHLVGSDGNAFALMGRFSNQARKDGWTKQEIDEVLEDAMSGDYDHLILTLCSYTLDMN